MRLFCSNQRTDARDINTDTNDGAVIQQTVSHLDDGLYLSFKNQKIVFCTVVLFLTVSPIIHQHTNYISCSLFSFSVTPISNKLNFCCLSYGQILPGFKSVLGSGKTTLQKVM